MRPDRMIAILRAAALTALLMLVSQLCYAQFSANVQGTVTDPKGAVLPGAAVTLHNVATGVDLQETTNATGFYRFTSVAPGDYAVQVSMQGFNSSNVVVPVTTSETRGVDVTLTVASAGTSVTVNSIASALNPEETRIEATLSSEEISKLPLANRDVQELLALTPGVVGYQNESPSNGYGSSIFAGSFAPPYSSNGQGNQSNLFLIDDLPVSDDISQGAALVLPNADSIDEVALQAQTFSVENGTAASLQTSFTTKSGGNKFHGGIDYSYAGKNVGAANNLVNSVTSGVSKVIPTSPEFHQNLILAHLGGPIFKDKTFFFGSIEKQLAGIGNAGAAGPNFDPAFVKWAVAAFPESGSAKGLAFAPNSRDTGGNTTGGLASDWYPKTCGTNQTVNGLQYNLPCDTPIYDYNQVFNQAQPFNGQQWNARIDQNFRQGKDRVYVQYERIDQTLGILAERPALDARSPSQNKYFSVSYDHIFSPKLLNEFHAGNLRAIAGTTAGDVRALSIPYLPILLDDDNFGPIFAKNGFNAQFELPFGATPFAAQTNKEHTYAVRDAVSYTIGNHVIRGGYQFYRGDYFQDSAKIYSRPFVPFYFTDTFSWISNTTAAGYSLYTISGATGHFTPQYYGATSIYNGVFVEDTWKVRPNLTVTVGLRYDNFGNPTKYGADKGQDATGPLVPLFLGKGSTFQEQTWGTYTKIAKHAFTQAQSLNVLPRAGFAYSPTLWKNFALHGGIGLYENVLTPSDIANNLPTQPPFRISTFDSSIVPYGDFATTAAPYGYVYPTSPVFGTDPFGNIYSNAAHTSVYSADLNGFIPTLKPEKYLNYSLGIEQQFGANTVFGVSYAGSQGYDLVYGSSASNGGANVDFNLTPGYAARVAAKTDKRPDTEWGKLNYGLNGLRSNFNELIVTLKENYKGLSYQANYNWSKALQDSPTVADGAANSTFYVWPGAYLPKAYYGPTSFDVTNSFSFGGSYEVPKFTQNALLSQATSGWRLSALAIAQSGTPFTVTHADGSTDYQDDGSAALDGNGKGTPAFQNYTGTKRKGFSRKDVIEGAFKATDFVNPIGVGKGSPVLSQQGANTFRNLGYFSVNSGLAKAFSFKIPGVTENAKLVLRGEALNLLNRTNWGGIQQDISGGNGGSNAFGFATSAKQKRYLQIGGRFEF